MLRQSYFSRVSHRKLLRASPSAPPPITQTALITRKDNESLQDDPNTSFRMSEDYHTSFRMSSNKDFSSMGRVLHSSSRSSFRSTKMKIAPLIDEKSSATAILNSPEAVSFMENYNIDQEFENEKVRRWTKLFRSIP